MEPEICLVPLGDAVSLVSGNTPSKQNPAYWGTGTAWVSAKDMAQYSIIDAEDHLTEQGSAQASHVVQSGTVLMLVRGMTLHKRVPICRVLCDAAFNQDIKAVLPKEGISRRFLPYLLVGNHDRIHSLVDSAGHGTGRLNTPELLSLQVLIPSLKDQEEIGRFGEALDDRIDLLRQTNTTLEAIAQALFKSWFVDFDPVHAKSEGRAPEAMNAPTAALFPSEFEQSELGIIPKGWCAGRLGDVSSNIRDQAKPDKIDPDTPYFGLEHMPRKSIALNDHGTADGLGSSKFWFQESDILFGKLRPYFHKVGLAPFKGICSTDILVLRPLQAAFHAFLLMHTSSDVLIDYATRLSNGAKMPRSSWKDIANYPLCVPPDSTLQAFNETVDPMLRRIKANIEAASTLAKLRDTLLPRLISGKLRLPKARETAEAALA